MVQKITVYKDQGAKCPFYVPICTSPSPIHSQALLPVFNACSFFVNIYAVRSVQSHKVLFSPFYPMTVTYPPGLLPAPRPKQMTCVRFLCVLFLGRVRLQSEGILYPLLTYSELHSCLAECGLLPAWKFTTSTTRMLSPRFLNNEFYSLNLDIFAHREG